MRAAPAVSVCCHGGAVWRAVQSGLFALACAVVAAWGLAQLGQPLGWSLAPGAVAAALAWRLSAEPKVTLAWDGQHWAADGVPGELDVMIDVGAWLLLRLRPNAGGHARWIAVTAGSAGPAMHGLRAAAYSRPVLLVPAERPRQPVAD